MTTQAPELLDRLCVRRERGLLQGQPRHDRAQRLDGARPGAHLHQGRQAVRHGTVTLSIRYKGHMFKRQLYRVTILKETT